MKELKEFTKNEIGILRISIATMVWCNGYKICILQPDSDTLVSSSHFTDKFISLHIGKVCNTLFKQNIFLLNNIYCKLLITLEHLIINNVIKMINNMILTANINANQFLF